MNKNAGFPFLPQKGLAALLRPVQLFIAQREREITGCFANENQRRFSPKGKTVTPGRRGHG